MLQRGSWYVVVTVAAAVSFLMSDTARGQVTLPDGPPDLDALMDWREAKDLQELRDLPDNGPVVGLRDGAFIDMKRAFHAMRGKKAAPFHAMRGKKLKGNSGDISTIIAELRRQIMAGKRGSFFGMRGKRFGGVSDLEAEVASPIINEAR